MSTNEVFAESRSPSSRAECYFYHTIDLPGHGSIEGDWDLRSGINSYLGNVDFRGKRVLDVGAATGFLTFTAEQNGADVVAYDLSKEFAFDVAPSRYGYQRHVIEHRSYIDAVNNGFWLAHQALRSKAKMVYGTVYAVPSSIGLVDIAIFGCILLHLRDPILALQNAMRLTTQKVVIVEPLWKLRSRWTMRILSRLVGPYMTFAPEYWKNEPQGTWWQFTPDIIVKFAAALGFEKATLSYHEQIYKGSRYPLFTLVAERTQPRDDFGINF